MTIKKDRSWLADLEQPLMDAIIELETEADVESLATLKAFLKAATEWTTYAEQRVRWRR